LHHSTLKSTLQTKLSRIVKQAHVSVLVGCFRLPEVELTEGTQPRPDLQGHQPLCQANACLMKFGQLHSLEISSVNISRLAPGATQAMGFSVCAICFQMLRLRLQLCTSLIQ
jgi:hypothetical protein